MASRLVSKRLCDRATSIPVASGMVFKTPPGHPCGIRDGGGTWATESHPSPWHQGWFLTRPLTIPVLSGLVSPIPTADSCSFQ